MNMNIVTQHPVRSGLTALLIFILLSTFLVVGYVKKERSRDLMDWQARLSILADMRAASVEEWLDDRRGKLKGLSNNPTLKLYLSQYAQLDKDDAALQGQFSHVRNLLQAEANRFGFSNKSMSPVNTEQKTKKLQGLAVLSDKGDMLFSTRGFYKDIATQNKKIMRALETGKGEFLDMFKVDSEHVLYGFVKPVFHIQKANNQKAVGAVILLLNPASNLYRLLENVHLRTRSDESLLVRKAGLAVEFLSPRQDGLSTMYKMPLKNMQDVFKKDIELSVGYDYRNIKVLSLSREIRSTPWVLLQKINASEALQESDDHQQYLFITFFLVSVVIVTMFIAIWRHSTSVRLLKMTHDLETHTTLLNAVSDNINEYIFLIDENDKFVFANSSLVNNLNIDAQSICGKKMANVLGPVTTKLLQEISCDKKNAEDECVIPLLFGDNNKFFHISSVVPGKGEYKNAKLYVLHDISRIKSAQEKRDRLSKGIIATLVKAVDLHDPYCVDHSERTKEVALDIAHELDLEKDRCEALEMAAQLANIGKLFVPKEILTKMDALTKEESQALRKNITYAVDVLKELDFEGPVVDIIAQKNESLDGSGYPNNLKAEEIMLEARILSIANAFVAMASSRAYRKGKSIKEVTNILLEQSDTHYDRQVVAALFHIAENRNHWKNWQNVTQ
jgi:HD-GYP domain-containing protein (c-di-GMP phosphodiesterase class II)